MIKIPDGVTVQIENNNVVAKGPKGEVKKTFSNRAKVTMAEGGIEVETTDKALCGTLESIIGSMLLGAKIGYSRQLKVLYAHFPISIEVKGVNINIKNFLGEKQPRKTKLAGNTKVEVKGQSVTVSGPDKEAVGQTIANLRTVLRIRDKDGRIFQDGIYLVQGE